MGAERDNTEEASTTTASPIVERLRSQLSLQNVDIFTADHHTLGDAWRFAFLPDRPLLAPVCDISQFDPSGPTQPNGSRVPTLQCLGNVPGPMQSRIRHCAVVKRSAPPRPMSSRFLRPMPVRGQASLAAEDAVRVARIRRL